MYYSSNPFHDQELLAADDLLLKLANQHVVSQLISSSPVHSERLEVPPVRVSLRHWCKA